MARQLCGSPGRSRYASRALALASLHCVRSISAKACFASRRDCQLLIAPPIGGAAKYSAMPSAQTATAPRKVNRRIRRARISSGGIRSRSFLFATGRDGRLATRDVYYGVAAYATRGWPWRGHLRMLLSAEGAIHHEPGAAPQFWKPESKSAESAIHSGTGSVHYRCRAPVAQQSHFSHHFYHQESRALA